MKAAILAGGFGTRLQEKTIDVPKPMVEIGGLPILWHIMKLYSHYGINEFVIALGYKGHVIKEFFLNYRYRTNSMRINLREGDVNILNNEADDWNIHLLETGLTTMTGGRVKQICQYIGNEPFLLTYGDGVANVDLNELISFHRQHGRLATVTAVRPVARFGEITFEGEQVAKFEEKPQIGSGWINGGFFILEPGVSDYIEGDETIFERQPLTQMANDGQLMAYRHQGFWQCMDTVRDVNLLNALWEKNEAAWKVWDE
ncbi:glucose-1-phosphate cytidylyltransferase [Chloroflexota bacterium]